MLEGWIMIYDHPSPNYLVAYMLNMTASAIVFLAEADEKALI